MNRIITLKYLSPVGELLLGDFQGQLCLCDWKYRKMRGEIDNRIQKLLNAEYISGTSPLLQETIKQLEEYFLNNRKKFDLELKLAGTDFQKNVWNELINIPFGTTETYLELSKKLKNEKAIRAVASANGANAISIIVPCHRIIGSDGKLVGYAGGLKVKQQLLQLEGSLNNNQLSLFSD